MIIIIINSVLILSFMQRKPGWLKVELGGGEEYNNISRLIRNKSLHTICEEAKCPNKAECFSNGTATFLILGENCTRNCLYCNVNHKKPTMPDFDEPRKIAEAVKELGLKYVVITSVTRDDLDDYGAGSFCSTVSFLRKLSPDTRIELLIPDFKGNEKMLGRVIDSGPDVLGHNIEVTENIFNELRPLGDYRLSLSLLKNIKKISPEQRTKSGLMVGLGESKEDIIKTMNCLRDSGVDFLTIGQYLQPRKDLVGVKKYYSPKEFAELKKIGISLGFSYVESGPLVRSSYRADRLNKELD